MIESLRVALLDTGLVQSFSGVRTVFGLGPGIRKEHETLAAAYGYCYAADVLAGRGQASLVLGRDPRPTGNEIVRAIARGFIAWARNSGCEIELIDLGIITTPLAQTSVRALNVDGGVIVTASHNPIEHNGFKFLSGVASAGDRLTSPPGALISALVMNRIIGRVVECSIDSCLIDNVTLDEVDEALGDGKNEISRVTAERAYLDVIGRDWGITPHCLKPLTLGPVLLDPNGGAGCGIDARVLEHFGVRVIEINNELGYPEHSIDTDGIDPASGRHMLLRLARAAARAGAHFAVAFDYDADRGNLVLPGHEESAIVPPQQVATFNVALALARRRLTGGRGPLAVVMSDSTSLASHRVAEAFGAEIFQVETGEINVVTRMHDLRMQGYDVPVGVEGANGGTIYESSTCRDGLQVALSAAQAESTPEVACEWMHLVSGMNGCRFDDSQQLALPELIESVPVNSNIMLKLSTPSIPHGEVKRRMEEYFSKSLWTVLQSRFESYEFQNFEGMEMPSERTGDESGAWRLMLRSSKGRSFIFFRGSRTEAGVWRMIIDADDASDFAELKDMAQQMFAITAVEG